MRTPTLNDILAENLAQKMADKGHTQASLAKLSGVGQTTISLYLNPGRRQPSKSGKVPSAKFSEVESLAEALGVPAWLLLIPGSAQSGTVPEDPASGKPPLVHQEDVSKDTIQEETQKDDTNMVEKTSGSSRDRRRHIP